MILSIQPPQLIHRRDSDFLREYTAVHNRNRLSVSLLLFPGKENIECQYRYDVLKFYFWDPCDLAVFAYVDISFMFRSI